MKFGIFQHWNSNFPMTRSVRVRTDGWPVCHFFLKGRREVTLETLVIKYIHKQLYCPLSLSILQRLIQHIGLIIFLIIGTERQHFYLITHPVMLQGQSKKIYQGSCGLIHTHIEENKEESRT